MKKFSEAVADAWGVPRDVIMNVPRLTILGGEEIYIENHKGISDYKDNYIKILTGEGYIGIDGDNLNISAIRAEDILIKGKFRKIEYKNQ